jgi:hypothetical protein
MYRCLILLVGLIVVPAAVGEGPTAGEKQTTVAWLKSLQKENGGFAGDTGKEASLRATISALRAIKFFGGEVPNPQKCEQFLLSERDPSGGFRRPDKRSAESKVTLTALGVMALAELNKDPEALIIDIDYLLDYASTQDEIRIATAALDSVYAGSIRFPVFDRWLREIQKARNPDGSWGVGGDRARVTAATTVTLLRLGGPLDKKEEILQTLKSGQRSDGGWGSGAGEGSDLASTYVVMRAFVVLKAKPDVAACQAFVAKCRNENGSYKLQLGGGQRPDMATPQAQRGPAREPPDAVTCTYHAAAITHWLETLK